MHVSTTGLIFKGRCEVNGPQCETKNKSKPITAVLLQNNVQINTCRNCLEANMRDGLWKIEGACTPNMTYRPDIEIVNNDGKKCIIEIKRKIDTHSLFDFIQKKIIFLENIVYFMLLTPTITYLFNKNQLMALDKENFYKIDLSKIIEHYNSCFNNISIDKNFASRNTFGARFHSHLTVIATMIISDLIRGNNFNINLPIDFLDFLKDSKILNYDSI